MSVTTSTERPLDNLDLATLRKRSSAKWSLYPDDVLPLWVAEMDAMPCDAVTEAVTAALRIGDTGYAYGNAYAEALEAYASEHWSWAFDPAKTVKVADVITGLTDLVRLLTDEGDAVVITPPVYPPFFNLVKAVGRRVVTAPLTDAGRFDMANIEHAFQEATEGNRPAVFMISNPHNPTGVVATRDEFEQVQKLAKTHSVTVVSDEIHAHLIMPGVTYTPYLSIPGTENDFAVISASKGWNLAGFKSALIVPGAAVADNTGLMAKLDRHGAGHLGLIAQTAALNNGRDWLNGVLAGMDENRRTLATLLKDLLPDTTYQPPEGTYLAWVDCTALGLGDDPAEAFLEKGRVAFSSGIPFGPGGEGHVRINMATSKEILTDAIRRMASVVPVAAD